MLAKNTLVRSEIKTIRLKSFDSFYQLFCRPRNNDTAFIYRGQRDDYPLEPKLLREVRQRNRMTDFYKIEKQMFQEFKESIVKNNNYRSISDLEILCLAQHYGLPTRLLDWSEDPLIALWFAFEEEHKTIDDDYRVVWGLAVDEDFLLESRENIFQQRFIRVFKPSENDPRVRAQKAWFSIQDIHVPSTTGTGDGLPHPQSEERIDIDHNYQYNLIKIQIPNILRPDIINRLCKLGVDHYHVFPDMEGLCKKIYFDFSESTSCLI